MEQRTDDWYAARLGKVTGSRIKDVMAKGVGKAPSKIRAEYMYQLAAERITGEVMPNYVSAPMQWGIDTEPQAKAFYTFSKDTAIEELAFADHPIIGMSGASPDGLIGDDGLIEIKCPNTATHLATLDGKSIDGAYMKQMQWQMACTGRQWCDYMSFDPRLPFAMQMHVQRVERDAELICEIEEKVKLFLKELDEMEQKLRGMSDEQLPQEAVG